MPSLLLSLLLSLALPSSSLKCVSSNGYTTLSPNAENRTIVDCDSFCSMSSLIVEGYQMDDGTNTTIFAGLSRSCGFSNRFIGPNGGCLTTTHMGRKDILCLCTTDYCNL